MSTFRENWPTSAPMSGHIEYMQGGLEVINDRLLLPGDGRWDIAYGSLVMGGQDGAVFAEGQPGAGKTAFGNIVMGEGNRVDIAATDTVQELEGFESQVTHQRLKPKLILDSADVRLFLNELSHLRDTGPIHKYWDGEELLIGNETFPLVDASIYATANFPDGHRSKKIDGALRSRMAISVLAGDNGKDTAAILHGMTDHTPMDEQYRDGLLPSAKVRGAIRAEMQTKGPMDAKSGQFVANVLDAINKNPLLQGVDLNDRRTSLGWAQAVRASRLVGGERLIGAISPEELLRVTGLALGSVAALSSVGTRELRTSNEPMSKLEAAVLARRMVAGIAMREYIDMDIVRKLKKGEMDGAVGEFMQAGSYASLVDNTRTDELMVANIVAGKPAEEGQNVSKRRFGRRRDR